MRVAVVVSCLSSLVLGGCASTMRERPHAVVEAASANDISSWRGIATPADQQRIDELPVRWARIMGAAPASARGRTAGDRRLMDPAAALPLPALTPGAYLCPMRRLGGPTPQPAVRPEICFVTLEGGKLSFTRASGAPLPGGWLYADGEKRLVLLASDRPRAAASAPAYGTDPARNIIGVVERIGPFRWRLTALRSGANAPVEIYDLTPSSRQPV